MLLLEAPVLIGIVLGGMICSWSQTVMLYCRLNFEFFACYKSMWHIDNYRYALIHYPSHSLFLWLIVVLIFVIELLLCCYMIIELEKLVILCWICLKKMLIAMNWIGFLFFFFFLFLFLGEGRGHCSLARISNVNHTICQKI